MSPKAMKKSVSGTFWELMLRHPAGCIVFLVIPLVAVVLVLVVAFLGSFALWVCQNDEHLRRANFPWLEDFWFFFLPNLGYGFLFCFSFALFCATTYGYSVWIPKLWKRRKEGNGRVAAAVLVVILGFFVPGAICEVLKKHPFHFYNSPFWNLCVWVVATMQGVICCVHLILKYFYKKLDKKVANKSVPKIELEPVNHIERGGE